MEFVDTPEEAAFRAEARAFLDANAELKRGDDRDWSRGNLALDPEVEEDYHRRTLEWQRTLYDNGWAGLTWPKEYGGRGDSIAHSMIFGQVAGDFDVTTGFAGAVLQLVGPPILKHGTDAQRERYIRPMLAAEEQWCQLFSEPGSGSDLASLATKAVRDGDDWIVNGQKVWTSSGSRADFGILIARTDPDAPKHKGITFFIVDMKTPGIDVRPLVQATGMSEFNEVFLTDVRVPAENVIGEVDEGWVVARTTMASEAGLIGGAGQSGSFQAVLEIARACDATDDLRIRQRLADVYVRERVLKFMGMRMQTAILHRNIAPPDPSILKNFVAESWARRSNLAVELQGATGMLLGDAPQDGFWQLQCMSRYKVSIGGGTTEVHKNNIGERALKLPREPNDWHGKPWSETPRS